MHGFQQKLPTTQASFRRSQPVLPYQIEATRGYADGSQGIRTGGFRTVFLRSKSFQERYEFLRLTAVGEELNQGAAQDCQFRRFDTAIPGILSRTLLLQGQQQSQSAFFLLAGFRT